MAEIAVGPCPNCRSTDTEGFDFDGIGRPLMGRCNRCREMFPVSYDYEIVFVPGDCLNDERGPYVPIRNLGNDHETVADVYGETPEKAKEMAVVMAGLLNDRWNYRA